MILYKILGLSFSPELGRMAGPFEDSKAMLVSPPLIYQVLAQSSNSM